MVVLTILITAFAAQAVFAVSAAAPHAQDPGYPEPGSTIAPPPSNNAYPEPGADTPSAALPTATVTNTPTLPPDVFRTEDAEMGEVLVTPPGDATPAPTHTLINTATPTPTTTATPEPTVVAAVEEEGFQMDWGLFSIGFAIPILIGCGVVLYLLDRRPDFFSRRSQNK